MSGLPDFDRARQYALDRLASEIPARLCYHSLEHTRDSVVPAVERLAALSGVEGEVLLLLRTAAYYHDLGWVVPAGNVPHELNGIRIARDVLPGFGYSPDQVQVITDMILATRLPQSPQNLAEQLLADADLDVLGREDFWDWNVKLRREMAGSGHAVSDEAWYVEQLNFLQSHQYWTPAAHQLRDGGKQKHLATIAALLSQARAASA
jgi:uncharacterized protein